MTASDVPSSHRSEHLPSPMLLHTDAMASGGLSSSCVAYGLEAFAVSCTMHLMWVECSDIDVGAIETMNSEQ